MPHTHGRYMQDLGFPDGRVFCSPGDIVWDVPAQAAIARTAAGQWVINHVAGVNTTNYAVNITDMVLRRLGFFEDLQEQFGGLGIPASAEIPGRPDTFGSMNKGQQLTPRTAFKIKGFQLTGYDIIYSLGTANLTGHTTRVDYTTYPNGLAPVTTNLLPSAANGLTLVTAAQPFVVPVVIPPNNQLYFNLADEVCWIEVQAITASTSAYGLIGIDAQVTFNYN